MTIDNGPTICMMSIAEGVTDKPTLDLRKEPLCLTPQEETKLSHFLNTELPRFNQVRGVTPLRRHKIHLENSDPIKQRYRPQNRAGATYCANCAFAQGGKRQGAANRQLKA